MEKEKLIEYLEIVVELEKQSYIQEITLKKLNDKINSLGIRRRYTRQEAVKRVPYWEPNVVFFAGLFAAGAVFFSSCHSIGDFFGSALTAVVVGFICSVLVGTVVELIVKAETNAQ